MIKKDDLILAFIENIRSLFKYFDSDICNVKKRMKCRQNQGKGGCIYILLNAPSLKTQDISVLKDKTTMFVNRGFMHPLYKEMQPKYHVFIDSKMIKGIWPVSWLDEIWSLSPKTTILLPASWYANSLFEKYKENENIYWMTETLPFYNLGVSGACFAFAIHQNFKKIYITGFDANGIGYEMIKAADSHFYGNDKELEGKSTKQFVIDLLMHSRHLHDLNRLAKYAETRDISIINLTNGGLLDMFPRENLLPLI